MLTGRLSWGINSPTIALCGVHPAGISLVEALSLRANQAV